MNAYENFLQKIAVKFKDLPDYKPKKDWKYDSKQQKQFKQDNSIGGDKKLFNRSTKTQQQAKKVDAKATKQTAKAVNRAKKLQSGYKTNLTKADINEEAARQYAHSIKQKVKR